MVAPARTLRTAHARRIPCQTGCGITAPEGTNQFESKNALAQGPRERSLRAGVEGGEGGLLLCVSPPADLTIMDGVIAGNLLRLPAAPGLGEQEWLPQVSREIRGADEWRKAMQSTVRHIVEAVTVTRCTHYSAFVHRRSSIATAQVSRQPTQFHTARSGARL
jgi:hypothetical protein